ncbi:MAG: transglutaminase domain-containing protein, partial [Limisphaerales bacterium]
MKTLRYLIFGLLAAAVTSQAQTITQPDFYRANNWKVTPVTVGSETTHAQISGGGGFSPMYSQDTPIAETITPDIQALADGLQDDPVKIFNYVHDHIKFVLYFGSKKGAELTLLEKSGNDFDQCALLVALLRAAGYSPSYEFG